MARGRIAAVGSLMEIRDLLDQHPSAVRIDSAAPRTVASHLLENPDVVGFDLVDDETLIVRARNPRKFFPDFGRLVIDEGWDIERLESLDDSAHAILGYLLGGRNPV
jgi:ABC-2 type transport system ATP-binding protein